MSALDGLLAACRRDEVHHAPAVTYPDGTIAPAVTHEISVDTEIIDQAGAELAALRQENATLKLALEKDERFAPPASHGYSLEALPDVALLRQRIETLETGLTRILGGVRGDSSMSAKLHYVELDAARALGESKASEVDPLCPHCGGRGEHSPSCDKGGDG